MKLFERAIRRADIPIAMSKGFNPHPRISIVLALGVGIAGKDEVLELELCDSMSAETLEERLGLQLPKGLQILSAEIIPLTSKSSVRDVTYEIIFKDTSLLETLKVDDILQHSSILVTRGKNGKSKLFNIRPSIQEIKTKSDGLILSIKATSEGITRPDEVLDALCKNWKKELFEITRTKIGLSSSTSLTE
jgi:radical SAM-linked protein